MSRDYDGISRDHVYLVSLCFSNTMDLILAYQSILVWLFSHFPRAENLNTNTIIMQMDEGEHKETTRAERIISLLCWLLFLLTTQTDPESSCLSQCSLQGFGLCCLMTPGLRKDIRCHEWPYTFLNLQITSPNIRPHIKWILSLVIAYGHFTLPQGFVWVCMG